MEKRKLDILAKELWAPEQITGYYKAKPIPMLSHESIYQFIYSQAADNPDIIKNLCCQHRKPKLRLYLDHKSSLIPNRVSIHENPSIVDRKHPFGYWEADLLESPNHNSIIVILSRGSNASPDLYLSVSSLLKANNLSLIRLILCL